MVAKKTVATRKERRSNTRKTGTRKGVAQKPMTRKAARTQAAKKLSKSAKNRKLLTLQTGKKTKLVVRKPTTPIVSSEKNRLSSIIKRSSNSPKTRSSKKQKTTAERLLPARSVKRIVKKSVVRNNVNSKKSKNSQSDKSLGKNAAKKSVARPLSTVRKKTALVTPTSSRQPAPKRIASPVVDKETPYPIKNLDNNVLSGVLHEASVTRHSKRSLGKSAASRANTSSASLSITDATHHSSSHSDTIIIAIHGFLSSKKQTLIRQTCIDLARAGYDAYRVDLSGNGDSEGRFEDATPTKLLRDITAIVNHWRAKYRRVVLLGHSLGAMLSLIVASRLTLDGLIVIGTPTHPETFGKFLSPKQQEELRSVGFTTWMVKLPIADVPYTITDRFVDDMAAQQPLAAAKEVRCPVLVVQGTADTVIPHEYSEELIGALQSKDLLLIGGADHNLTKPEHLDALISGIVEWLRRQI